MKAGQLRDAYVVVDVLCPVWWWVRDGEGLATLCILFAWDCGIVYWAVQIMGALRFGAHLNIVEMTDAALT
eukprot:1936882-Amphidinium_carterae.1